MVTDTGGIDDKSFNASAWAGLQAAAEENDGIEPKYVASNAEADYEANLNAYVNQNCDFILAVGGLMGDGDQQDRCGQPGRSSSRSSTPSSELTQRLLDAVRHRAGRLPRPATSPRA